MKEHAISHRGLLLVISSPSGAGKSTIARALLARDSNLHLSVSVTTRPMRAGESDGKDYHFIDENDFEARRGRGDLLEWARVFGYHYGTLRAPVEEHLTAGRDILFDIDWQGARQLVESMGLDVVSIFILPPSLAALEQRLRLRKREDDSEIRSRLGGAREELSHWSEYDYIIVNNDLQCSVRQALEILSSERLRRSRLLGVSDFVGGLSA